MSATELRAVTILQWFSHYALSMPPDDVRMIWSIVRKAQAPKLRRPLPVGHAHNGNRKRALDCACCGASISYDGKWRMPARVHNFLALHNQAGHILQCFDFDGSLAGMVSRYRQPW